MANIAWSDVVNHAAELSTVGATAQTEILDYVNTVINVSLIDDEAGPKTKLVRIYLAAHMGTATVAASLATSAAGAISSRKEGDVAVTYAISASTAAAMPDSTSYGSIYLRLIKTTALKAPVLL